MSEGEASAHLAQRVEQLERRLDLLEKTLGLLQIPPDADPYGWVPPEKTFAHILWQMQQSLYVLGQQQNEADLRIEALEAESHGQYLQDDD